MVKPGESKGKGKETCNHLAQDSRETANLRMTNNENRGERKKSKNPYTEANNFINQHGVTRKQVFGRN